MDTYCKRNVVDIEYLYYQSKNRNCIKSFPQSPKSKTPHIPTTYKYYKAVCIISLVAIKLFK